MSIRDDLLDAVTAENEMLRERVRQLEAMIGITFESPPMFGFTRGQSIIFGMLLKNKLSSRESLMLAVYQGRSQDEADIKIIDVWVCHMRRKLKPFDIEIETQWGQGYYFKSESKAKALALLEQANAA